MSSGPPRRHTSRVYTSDIGRRLVAPFQAALDRAVEDGLSAAALVDRNGNTVALAGALEADIAMPLAALVMYRVKTDDLASRLFAGEVVSVTLDDREVAVGVARRQLFVVAVLGAPTSAMHERVRELRDDISRMIIDAQGVGVPPRSRGGGDSGPDPAELALAEYGISVPRTRGKA
jgi:hypothetical protein